MAASYTIGLVGARGYTGREILRLVAQHPKLNLGLAVSREFAGRPVAEVAPEIPGMTFENLSADEIAGRALDVIILALPDGAGEAHVRAITGAGADRIILDLSSDYRFDPGWVYGLPELYDTRARLNGATRIANPGCYATAAQMAIYPMRARLAGAPSVFGVSGYSGAGTKPSARNDPARLADNLIPYGLTGHKHEREISHHLGTGTRFTPHVHPAFSGLLTTVHLTFASEVSGAEMRAAYEDAYAGCKLIRIQDEAPELKSGTGIPGVVIGGFEVSADGRHGVVVAAEDNLLKGAAVQAIQNLNLALGLDEYLGLPGS